MEALPWAGIGNGKRKKLVKLIKGFKYINFNNNSGCVTMK